MSKMVSRILEQKEPIRLVLSSDRTTSHLVPTWQDLDVLESIDSAVSPLSGLTDILSGEQYATVSAVIPMLYLLESDLLKEGAEDTALTRNIKHRIVDDIKGRYSRLNDTVNEILQVATFLDPHFKVKYFEHVQEVELMSIKQKVTDDALEVCRELQEVQQNSSRAESSRTQEVAHSFLQPSAPRRNVTLELCSRTLSLGLENKNKSTLPLSIKKSSIDRS